MTSFKSNSFSKSERLCKKNDINKLFEDGNSFFNSPVVIYWLAAEFDKNYPVKVLISVPKKRIPKVVNRNLIKRRIREAYRVNKHELLNFCLSNNTSLHIGVIYSDNKIADYKTIEEKIIISLQNIINLLQ